MIEIFTATTDWSKIYDKFRNLDVYYSQEYVIASAEIEPQSIPLAIYYETIDARVWYPFLLRTIPGWMDKKDIVTPYGYGGPHLEGNPERIKDFYREFYQGFCKEENIVTETLRLHPLTENHVTLEQVIEVVPVRKTIAVDLLLPYDEILSGYSTNCRRNIQRSINKYGLTFEEKKGEEAIEIFTALYYQTMDRRDADQKYYFSREYFETMMQENPLCQPLMVFGYYEGQPISGHLILMGHRYAHAHLQGSNDDYLFVGPNHAMINYSVLKSKDAGLEKLHLGGGFREGDGIYQFKESFNKKSSSLFYLGKHILNNNAYQEIVESLSVNPEDYPDFFPIYRHPDVNK